MSLYLRGIRFMALYAVIGPLFGATVDSTCPVGWSHPKLPARIAQQLRRSGNFDLVNDRFQRVCYLPWPAFNLSDRQNLSGFSGKLPTGGRFALVAVKGRKHREIAGTLAFLAASD